MFVIPVKTRFILIAVLIIGGILVSFLPYGLAYSWLLYIPGLVLLVGYFLLGTVGPASKALQMGDLEGAEKQLSYTWKPNWMLKWNRGTYHFLLGTIAVQRRDFEKTELYMNKALEVGLPSDDFTAQVYLVLAQVSAAKGKRTAAKNHIRSAKKLNIKQAEVIQGIKQIEQQLKMVPKGGMSQHQQMMGKGVRAKRRKMK